MAGTLTFSLDGGSERHYSVDRIAYIDINSRETKRLQLVLTGTLLLFGVLILAVSQSILAMFFPLAIAVVTYLLLRTNDAISIGTTTDEDQIQIRNTRDLEAEYKEKAEDVITVEGATDGLLVENDYRYYLAPSNIVRVEQRSRSIGVGDILLLLISFLIPPSVGVVLFGILAVASFAGSVPIMFLIGIVFSIAVYYRYIRSPSGVAVQLENGNTKIFAMADNDANHIVKEFQQAA